MSCGIAEGDRALCWGANYVGQTGCGETSVIVDSPHQVVGLDSDVTAISAGTKHACALQSQRAYCWGGNDQRQLGDGTLNDSAIPVEPHGLGDGVLQIAAGSDFTCAIDASGFVSCWGRNNHGQLGVDSGTVIHVPRQVAGLPGPAQALAVGALFTCATVWGGQVFCWGNNLEGQLGDGTSTSSPTPVAVLGLEHGVLAIDAGDQHACAVTGSRTLRCWGSNRSGCLGDGTRELRLSPVEVIDIDAAVNSVSCGGDHTCAVLASGRVKCWGTHAPTAFGDELVSSEPIDWAVRDHLAETVSAGYQHTCVLDRDHEIWCWGLNPLGQLGDANSIHTMPVRVAGF